MCIPAECPKLPMEFELKINMTVDDNFFYCCTRMLIFNSIFSRVNFQNVWEIFSKKKIKKKENHKREKNKVVLPKNFING